MIGDDEQRDDEQDRHDDERGDVQHVLHGLEALGDLKMRLDLGNALDLRELVVGLLQKGVVFDGDDITVAQGIGVEAVKEVRVVLFVDEILQRLLARDEGRRANVDNEVDL